MSDISKKLSENRDLIFEHLDFRLKSKIREDDLKGIYSGEISGVRYLLKIGSVETSESKFKRELDVDALLSMDIGDSKKKFLKNQVISSGKINNYSWLLRQFLGGKSLSHVPDPNEELFYHPVDKDFVDREKELAGPIVDNILALQNIKVLKDFDSIFIQRFPRKFSNHELEKLGSYFNLKLESSDFLATIPKDYYSADNMKLCTGDLAPTNIIVDEDKVFFTDFEWLCVENTTVDIAYLWLFMWRYPIWQKSLYHQYFDKNEEEAVFFWYSIFRIIIFWFINLSELKDGRDRKKIVKDHIWTRYLISIINNNQNDLIS
jgi:hypothetical protein